MLYYRLYIKIDSKYADVVIYCLLAIAGTNLPEATLMTEK